MKTETANELPELSLIEGGPGDALMKRLRLIRPEFGTASARTAIILAVVTWLPLLVLSLIEGLALGGARIPFFYDIAAHTRFLVAGPILVLAEIPIGRRLRAMTRHFLNAGLVPESERKQFAACVLDTVRFHDSRLAELILTVVTYLTVYVVFSGTSFQSGSTWFAPSSAGFSPVGYYYAFVSIPIFQFLMYRWAFRIVVWTRLLWQISNLDLLLTPTHPDGAGGLGFLGKGTIPFGVILFALSSVLSASIASRILFGGATLEQFEVTYASLVVLVLIIFTGPLLVFAPKLFRLKQEGLLSYGTLASRYTQQFDSKWVVEGINVAKEPLLGTADLQSLADLGNSYELVRKMRVIPIELSDFIAIALPGVIPALPLAATVMPVGEILKQILRLLG
jgi:hypothetical protein